MNNYRSDTDNFHQSITSGDLENVRLFLEKYPKIKFAFSSDKESAASKALKVEKIEIYEILISSGLSLAPDEDIEEIVKDFKLEIKRELREIHKIYVKDSRLKHLTKLIARSKLAHDAPDFKRRKFFMLIAEAFEELNEIKWVEPMLKVVANGENLKLIFDFNRDSIEHMDPTANKRVKGICYFKGGDVYIGAKGLLDDDDSSKALSVIAHELSHYAMNLIYQNTCKPYKESDETSATEFDNILRSCEGKEGVEPYIDVVYRYPEHQRLAELIVRVPHLLALYKKNYEKLDNLKETFPELFHFYESKVLVDLQREHPLMEARLIIQEFNELSGLEEHLQYSNFSLLLGALTIELKSEKISIISSNCPQVTMQASYQLFQNDVSPYIFVKLETLKGDKMFELATNALSVYTEPTMIIDCDKQPDREIVQLKDKFRQSKICQRVVFVAGSEMVKCDDSDTYKVNHCWSQLALETQIILLDRQITFQGQRMSLGNLLQISSRALYSIPLNDLLEGKIEVGNDLSNDDSIYIERNYVSDFTGYNAFRLIEKAKKHEVILFSNEPGMGKTTELKKIALKIKRYLNQFNWIVFIDLKQHVEAFEKDGSVSQSCESYEEIAKYFCEKLLKLTGFEAAVFVDLFISDRVVLLLDGFDEISPSFKEFNLRLLGAIRKVTDNQLWISTRPHLEAELIKILYKENSPFQIYKLKPFTAIERENYMRKMLSNKNFSEEILLQKLKEVEEFLVSLENDSSRNDIYLVSNPLIIRMVTEIINENPDTRLLHANYYSLYDNFVNKTIQDYMKRGYDAEKESATFLRSSKNVIMSFHRKLAFLIMFKDSKACIDLCFKKLPLQSGEAMLRVGFLSSNQDGIFQFIHRTFAEFFIADFFASIFNENVDPNDSIATFLKENESAMELFRIIWRRDSNEGAYKMIRKFIDCAFESLISEENFEVLRRVKALILKLFSKHQLRSFFQLSIEEGFINIVKLFALEGDKSLEKLMRQKDHEGKNGIAIALKHQSTNFIENLTKLCSESFEDSLLELFLEKDSFGRNILFTALENTENQGIVELIVTNKLIALESTIILKLLTTTDERGTNLLMHALKRFSVEYLERIFGSFFMKHMLKKSPLKSFENLYEMIKNDFKEIDVKAMLNHVNIDNETVLQFAIPSLYKEQDLKTFSQILNENLTRSEITEMLFKISTATERSPTMNAVLGGNSAFWEFSEDTFDNLEDRKKLLLQTDDTNLTIFHCATKSNDKYLFKSVLSAYRNLFDDCEIKKLINLEDSRGEHILFHCMDGSLNTETIQELWTFIQDIFTNDNDELKEFFTKKNIDEETFIAATINVEEFSDKIRIFDEYVLEISDNVQNTKNGHYPDTSRPITS